MCSRAGVVDRGRVMWDTVPVLENGALGGVGAGYTEEPTAAIEVARIDGGG
jgi:hypothetical protein